MSFATEVIPWPATEEAYLHWIRRLLVFRKGTRPREMAEVLTGAL
jgi:hypothetical protein